MPVTVEEYKERLAAKLVEEAPTPENFRSRWVVPSERKTMLGQLPDGGRSAFLVRSLEGMDDYDLYDVLAELGYGLNPRIRRELTDAFAYKHAAWLEQMPEQATNAVKAIASQFARSGTEGLENPQIFQIPEIVRAGGLAALKAVGKPVRRITGDEREDVCGVGSSCIQQRSKGKANMIQAQSKRASSSSNRAVRLRSLTLASELPVGTEAEVLIMIEQAAVEPPPLASFIGKGNLSA